MSEAGAQVDVGSLDGDDGLTPILSARFALSWFQVGACVPFLLLFLYVGYVPLFHSVTWRHVMMGNWILENGSFPTEEPWLPLAEGIPFIASSWLSEVLIAQFEIWGGAQGLANALAISFFLLTVFLARVYYLRSQSVALAVAGAIYVIIAWWSGLGVLRPAIFGGFCLVGQLWMLARQHRHDTGGIAISKWLWFAMPLLLMIWANLDASFLLGLGILLCHAVGSLVDRVWRSRKPWGELVSRGTFQWIALVELSVLATCLNPYWLDLWAHAVRLQDNLLWNASGGYRPLTIVSWNGLMFALVWLAVMVVLRVSRRPISAVDVLLLAMASLAVVWNSWLMFWFAPLALFVLMPYLGELATRIFPSPEAVDADAEPQPLQFAASLVFGLLVWASFALSPLSARLLGGDPRSPEQLHSRRTPVAVAEFLDQSDPSGLIWAPADWCDWIQWSSGGKLNLFSSSGYYALPYRVRSDDRRIALGLNGWRAALDRYAVQILVLDKQRQDALIEPMRGDSNWTNLYEDSDAIIFSQVAS